MHLRVLQQLLPLVLHLHTGQCMCHSECHFLLIKFTSTASGREPTKAPKAVKQAAGAPLKTGFAPPLFIGARFAHSALHEQLISQ